MGNTRTVRMWLQNDEGLYNQVVQAGRVAVDRSESRGEANDLLAKEIQELVEAAVLDDLSGLAYDLMSDALRDVDWDDLADDEISTYEETEWVTDEQCQECEEDYDPEESEGHDSGLCQKCYEIAEKESSENP